jgi:ankyrin repeat protein
MLARKEIKINQASGKGLTPLIRACYNGHVDVVRLLLAQKDIKINQAMKDGRTPLYIAIREGHSEIADLLRKNGGQE